MGKVNPVGSEKADHNPPQTLVLRTEGYMYGRKYPQKAHLHVWRMALMLVSSRGRCSSTFASKSEGSASQAWLGACCFLSITYVTGSAHARTA